MHDYTSRQIEHVGDSMMRDRMFILNVVGSALGGGRGGKGGKGGKGKGKAAASRQGVQGAFRRQEMKARGAVNHFNRATPGNLTPGSRVHDLRGLDQKQAHNRLCVIMGQRPKE